MSDDISTNEQMDVLKMPPLQLQAVGLMLRIDFPISLGWSKQSVWLQGLRYLNG